MPIVAEAPENPRVAACSHTPPREHCTICLSKPLHARSAGLCEARPRRMPRTSLEKTRSAERTEQSKRVGGGQGRVPPACRRSRQTRSRLRRPKTPVSARAQPGRDTEAHALRRLQTSQRLGTRTAEFVAASVWCRGS
eukprot:1829896-Rhodomonas_salina.3